MPRPRVRPEDRRRSERACDACKTTKKRCDSKWPCSACVRRGVPDACSYAAPHKRKYPPLRRLAAVTEGQIPLNTNRSPSRIEAPAESSRIRNTHDNGNDETSHDSTPSLEQRPAMLLSSSGEKVFVGNTAALSFLNFLRHMLKRYVGPSNFTEPHQYRRMLEVDVPEASADSFENDLEEDEKSALIQCFLEASSGLLDLFTGEEIGHLLLLDKTARRGGDSSLGRTEKDDLALLYLIVAIGAQCRGKDRRDLSCATRLFTQARGMAFQDMLQDPNVNMVRKFLLLAFYMLGACRRNAAFMYIGVASKAAIILGLHASSEWRHMSKQDRDVRHRTSKSVRVFDLVCSSILGRPGTTLPLRTNDIHTTDLDRHSRCHRELSLAATYESSTVLESIVQKFAEDGKLDVTSAENFLQMLREWAQALPPELRHRPGVGTERWAPTKSREIMIGNIHTACTYYFGIILVTRQFLIQHTVPQLRGTHLGNTESDAPQDSGKTAELAQACTNAATYMAQMCCEASDAGVLLGNMCILKAWVFVAGLVLGFSLLLDQSPNSPCHDAFHGSRQILNSMGRLSPQAAQYYHILTSFSESISAYREARLREQASSKVTYVEKILDMDSSGKADNDGEEQSRMDSPDFGPFSTTVDGSEGDENATILSDTQPNQSISGDWERLDPADPIMNLIWSDAVSFMESLTSDLYATPS